MKHLDAITQLKKVQDVHFSNTSKPTRERKQTNKKRPIFHVSDYSDNHYSANKEEATSSWSTKDEESNMKQLPSKEENITRLSLYAQEGTAGDRGCHGGEDSSCNNNSSRRSSIGVPLSGGRLSSIPQDSSDKTLLLLSSSLFPYNTMYHPHQIPSASTSTSSSYTARMMLLDQQTQLSPPVTPRDSIFIKQALKKQQQQQQLQRKRRESVGEVVSQYRKRPLSAIKPRLTQSSILQTSKRKRQYSMQQPINDFLDPEVSTPPAVHWDPHIDAFEILRAKITGITRSMQEFHVQELFQDEKRSYFPTATTSSPLISHHHHVSHPTRRLSLANLNENNSLGLGHRRIKSQNFAYDTDNKQCNDKDSDSASLCGDSDEDCRRLMTSPNLTALFLTTNNLINSRLDELCDTASVKSSSDSDWQKQFLSLVTGCIHQSEALESLSTDVLNTEHRVRELMLINETLHEQFHEREKQYEDRIRQCQEVAQQQLMMIDSLEELTADINMKMESRTKEMHRQQALMALDIAFEPREEERIEDERWNFQQSVADLLNMDDKHDIIQKMRWEIGMLVGGGVGTGHVIHSFDNKLNGIDMMIAGSGTTTTLQPDSCIDDDDDDDDDDEDDDDQEENDYHTLDQVIQSILYPVYNTKVIAFFFQRLFRYHLLFVILNYINIITSSI
jgi:hypothetical protein